MDEQRENTEEILRRLRNVPRHIKASSIRALPSFSALYDTLDTPHRLQVDAELRKRFA